MEATISRQRSKKATAAAEGDNRTSPPAAANALFASEAKTAEVSVTAGSGVPTDATQDEKLAAAVADIAAGVEPVEAPIAEPVKRPPALLDIHPEAIATYWDRIEPLVREAINASPVQPKLETPIDVLKGIQKGLYNLHVIVAESRIQLVLITHMETYERANVCHVVYGAGNDLVKWINHFRSQFCEGARMHNCRFIQIHVPDEKRGRMIEQCGFVETSRTYSLEI